MKYWQRLIQLSFIIVIIGGSYLFVEAAMMDEEYVLKAAFIERFTRFIEWPDSSTINDPETPCLIGVLGENPFGTTLTDYYKKQTIYDKEVQVLFLTDTSEIDTCHILFLGRNIPGGLSQVLDYVQEKPILTISDTNGYGEQGVHINMYVLRNKIRYEINVASFKSSPLRVSSFLLDNAKVINN